MLELRPEGGAFSAAPQALARRSAAQSSENKSTAIAEFEEALRLAQREGVGDANASASIAEQLRGLRAMLN